MTTVQPALASSKCDLHLQSNGTAQELWCGCALVCRAEPHLPAWNLLAAQLYNAQFPVGKLTVAFNCAASTLRRWGSALKEGAVHRVVDAKVGAPPKLSGEIERFVRMRFRQIHRDTPNYSVVIRGEVTRIFEKEFSGESLRPIFSEERAVIEAERNGSVSEEQAHSARPISEAAVVHEQLARHCEEDKYEPAPAPQCVSTTTTIPPGLDTSVSPEKGTEGARSVASEAITCDGPSSSRSNPPPPPNQSLWRPDFLTFADAESRLCHFAGLLLAGHVDDFLQGWPSAGELSEGPQASRQLLFQLLSGATNHEQSKLTDSANLSLIAGRCLSTIVALRERSQALAGVEALRMLGGLNQSFALPPSAQTAGVSAPLLLFVDPHSEEYTGKEKLLKGWLGSAHAVRKVLYSDFIHTRAGAPCFLVSDDNRCDFRERFFTLRARFVQTLPPNHGKLIWISDRGLFGKETFKRIMDEGDGFITWERGYKADGWSDSAKTHRVNRHRCRNSSKDRIGYQFQYQVSQWDKLDNVTRLVVRASGQDKPRIEVSILCGNIGQTPLSTAIWAIFRRWLQENDFSYLIRHFDLGQLDSREFISYGNRA